MKKSSDSESSIIIWDTSRNYWIFIAIAFTFLFVLGPFLNTQRYGITVVSIAVIIYIIFVVLLIYFWLRIPYSILKIDSKVISYTEAGLNIKPKVEWEYRFSEIEKITIKKSSMQIARIASVDALQISIFKTRFKVIEKEIRVCLYPSMEKKLTHYSLTHLKNKLLIE